MQLDPTYIIGGILNTDGVSNRLGKSQYLLAEADESDGSFLKLNPIFSVITNIDKDHMQTYDFSEEKLQQALLILLIIYHFTDFVLLVLMTQGCKPLLIKYLAKL